MRVHIEINHALAGTGQSVAGQRNIVEITKASRIRRHVVMKATEQIERDVDLARGKPFRRHEARAASPR